jgi:hypothetical protein
MFDFLEVRKLSCRMRSFQFQANDVTAFAANRIRCRSLRIIITRRSPKSQYEPDTIRHVMQEQPYSRSAIRLGCVTKKMRLWTGYFRVRSCCGSFFPAQNPHPRELNNVSIYKEELGPPIAL